MEAEGRVGPSISSDGAVNTLRLGKLGGAIVADGGGRYEEAAYRGILFFACNQAAIASTAGLNTASKIFTLYNPAGSGKVLFVMDTVVTVVAIPANLATMTNIFWAGNVNPLQAAPSSVTAETIRGAILGYPANSAAAVYNTCTLAATPVAVRMLGSIILDGTAASVSSFTLKDEISGALGVYPGCYISIQASAAVATFQCSATWLEYPI